VEGGNLEEKDFIPETGEPRILKEVYDKIARLGARFCEGHNVRRGAVFGYYYGQPNEGAFAVPEDSKYAGFTDSPYDFDEDNNNGTLFFIKGFKWTHHYYCDVPAD
jgi:hypothetical protein